MEMEITPPDLPATVSGPPNDFVLDSHAFTQAIVVRGGPKWYHFALLAVCTLVLVAEGYGGVHGGSSPTSRFHAIDDVVVRALGVLLIAAGLAIWLRHRWVFNAAIACLSASIVEEVTTFVPAESGDIAVVAFIVLILMCGPMALLFWLRAVFARPISDVDGAPFDVIPRSQP